jgi:FSR family fosmidomycin resistance protein-like MFS transporter
MTSATKTLISLGLAHALLEWFSGVWPIFKVLAHLDLTTSAEIVAATSFIASILQPLFGIWADKGFARRMALGGTVLTFLLMLVGPISNCMPVWGPLCVYTMLGAITLLSRIGHSMFHPAGAMLSSRTHNADKHTSSLGIFISMGWIGYGLSQIAFCAAYLNFGGHTEVLLLPGILVMFWILAWCKPAPQAHAHVHIPFREKVRDVWTYRRDLGLLFALMCLTGAANSALFFLFPELIADKGYSGWVFNGGAQGFMIAGTVLGVVVSGYCAEGMGERLALIVSMAANIVAWHSFLMIPHVGTTLFMVVCTVAGVLFGFGSTLPISMGQKLIPRNASMISGVMMGWSWAIANLAPLAAAQLARYPSLGIYGALTILGVLNVLALVCSAFLKPAEQKTRVIQISEPLAPAASASSARLRA